MTGHTPWRDIKHKRFSSDVGDEHVERESQFPRPEMQEIGKPPTQPPPKPADARQSVEPPAYRYKPNLERLSRRSFVEKGDRKIVEGMLRHTRPLTPEDAKPVAKGDVSPIPPDEIEYQYPYQDEAADVLEEFIKSHVLAFKMKKAGYYGQIDTYIHDPKGCKHCEAKSALDLLNGIIQTQAKKLREYEDAMAIQWEMYGDPAKLQERAENAEIELGRLYEVNRNQEQILDETRQQLSSCNVDLHNSKQHELGLMCAEQTDKLEAIRKRISEVKHGDGYWLAFDIEDILDGTSE